MWAQPYRKADTEAGARLLYPMMLESPQLRWAFIRKVYSILTFQLFLTIAVAATVVTIHPVAVFFATTGIGLALYILLILMPFGILIPLYYYHQKHPVNYILLGIFTISLAFAVGLTCAFTEGKVILESVILTTVVVVSLTLYTFWAARRGHDFNFLGPFLFGAVLVLMVFALIQILFPLGRISIMIYGCLASIIFCGYIVYDTDNLIKRFSLILISGAGHWNPDLAGCAFGVILLDIIIHYTRNHQIPMMDFYGDSTSRLLRLMELCFSEGNRWSDVEAGAYPIILDDARHRWIFIRKVYFIIAIQLLVTAAVAATVILVHPIADFIVHTKVGLAVYIVIIVIPFIVLCPLYYFYRLRPVNYLLLGIFTIALGFVVGLTCAFTSEKVILESAIITSVAVVNLTLYTFWAARRGHDFSFLGPFLAASLIALLLFVLIQIIFPLGKISVMIFGFLASIIFCGYIIYDTDNLIKRYSYDEYIWAAVSLYLDIINLFLSVVTLCSAEDS